MTSLMQGVGGRGQNIASGSLSVFLSVYSKISTKVETLLELRANYLGSQEFSALGMSEVRFDHIAQILLIIQLETTIETYTMYVVLFLLVLLRYS